VAISGLFVLDLGNWDSEFIWNLVLVIWDLNFKFKGMQ
jgi:hypothetical protein